jgi:hypothetical protein
MKAVGNNARSSCTPRMPSRRYHPTPHTPPQSKGRGVKSVRSHTANFARQNAREHAVRDTTLDMNKSTRTTHDTQSRSNDVVGSCGPSSSQIRGRWWNSGWEVLRTSGTPGSAPCTERCESGKCLRESPRVIQHKMPGWTLSDSCTECGKYPLF